MIRAKQSEFEVATTTAPIGKPTTISTQRGQKLSISGRLTASEANEITVAQTHAAYLPMVPIPSPNRSRSVSHRRPASQQRHK